MIKYVNSIKYGLVEGLLLSLPLVLWNVYSQKYTDLSQLFVVLMVVSAVVVICLALFIGNIIYKIPYIKLAKICLLFAALASFLYQWKAPDVNLLSLMAYILKRFLLPVLALAYFSVFIDNSNQSKVTKIFTSTAIVALLWYFATISDVIWSFCCLICLVLGWADMFYNTKETSSDDLYVGLSLGGLATAVFMALLQSHGVITCFYPIIVVGLFVFITLGKQKYLSKFGANVSDAGIFFVCLYLCVLLSQLRYNAQIQEFMFVFSGVFLSFSVGVKYKQVSLINYRFWLGLVLPISILFLPLSDKETLKYIMLVVSAYFASCYYRELRLKSVFVSVVLLVSLLICYVNLYVGFYVVIVVAGVSFIYRREKYLLCLLLCVCVVQLMVFNRRNEKITSRRFNVNGVFEMADINGDTNLYLNMKQVAGGDFASTHKISDKIYFKRVLFLWMGQEDVKVLIDGMDDSGNEACQTSFSHKLNYIEKDVSLYSYIMNSPKVNVANMCNPTANIINWDLFDYMRNNLQETDLLLVRKDRYSDSSLQKLDYKKLEFYAFAIKPDGGIIFNIDANDAESLKRVRSFAEYNNFALCRLYDNNGRNMHIFISRDKVKVDLLINKLGWSM